MGQIFHEEDYDEGHADGYEAGSRQMALAASEFLRNSAELLERQGNPALQMRGMSKEELFGLISNSLREAARALDELKDLSALDREFICRRKSP